METKFSLSTCNQFIQRLEEPSTGLGDLEEDLSIQLDLLYHNTKVPILSNNDDVPYEKHDFTHVLQICERNLSTVEQMLKGVLKKLENDKCSISSPLKASCTNCIVLAAQYTNNERDWSTLPASRTACRILSLLLQPSGGVTGWEVLEGKSRKSFSKDDETSEISSSEVNPQNSLNTMNETPDFRFGSCLKSLLSYISLHFTKTLWKNDPGCQEFMMWLLHTLSRDDLSSNIGSLLPGVLLLLDDWETRHKIPALNAILHIINNVAGSELRCYGHASVMYEAAKHHLYSRDPALLEAAYPAATAAATVLLQDSSCAHSAQLSPPEEVLSMLLRDMAFEQRLDLRAVYVSCLPRAIAAAGLRSIRWQAEVVQVLCSYITTYEGPAAQDRLNALKALHVYCESCWPQAGRRREDLLKAVLQLIYSSSAPGGLQLQPQVQETLLEECRSCVQLLMRCKPDPDPDLLTGLLSLELPPAVQTNLNTVFGELDL